MARGHKKTSSMMSSRGVQQYKFLLPERPGQPCLLYEPRRQLSCGARREGAIAHYDTDQIGHAEGSESIQHAYMTAMTAGEGGGSCLFTVYGDGGWWDGPGGWEGRRTAILILEKNGYTPNKTTCSGSEICRTFRRQS